MGKGRQHSSSTLEGGIQRGGGKTIELSQNQNNKGRKEISLRGGGYTVGEV